MPSSAFTIDPRALSLPERFDSLRDAQVEAVEHVLTSDKRFVALGLPTGVGKSILAVILHKMLGGRTVILTGTLGLQDQYDLTFRETGLTDVRGRGNFPCWNGGTCEDGAREGCGDHLGCPYKIQFAAGQASDLVCTSYALWLAAHEKAQGMAPADTLICDEAAQASEWLSRALDFTIGERECREAGLKLGSPGEDLDEWKKLAPAIEVAARAKYLALKSEPKPPMQYQREQRGRALKRWESLCERTLKLQSIGQDNWVCSRKEGRDDGRLWRFECVWPGQYRERLFRGVKRVVLMSGTLRPKTMQLLGIPRADVDFREWPRQFSAKNGPVIWLKNDQSVRVNHRMSDEDKARWLDLHREITDSRSDRRGLVQTVSYMRAKEIGEALDRKRVVLNGAADPDSQTARQAYDRFIVGRADGILVSPSFSTGWDFPGAAAEYQIISKLPMPDTRSKVMQARLEKDNFYADYLAAQELVQSCGRVVRGPDDRGETIIVDANLGWFMNKAEGLMPKWFQPRKEERLPAPLEKIVT